MGDIGVLVNLDPISTTLVYDEMTNEITRIINMINPHNFIV